MEKYSTNISETNGVVTTPIQNQLKTSNQEKEGTKLIIPITLNNHNHELVVECTLGEKQYYGPMGEDESYPDIYPQTIKVSMDGKDYKILENNQIGVTKGIPVMAKMPNIVAIKSKEGKEYIAITVKLTANTIDESLICILDENGEIIGKIKDYGKTKFILENIGQETIPSYTINKDSIDIIKPTKDGDAEIHQYIIEAGKIKVEEVIKQYTKEEIGKVGTKYSEEEMESNHIY